MRGATVTLMAVGFVGVLAVAMPVRAEDQVIEHKSESMRVETAPAPVVKKETHEKTIERQAAPATVEKKSKTVVKKGHDDNDNGDDDEDLND